MPLACQKPLLLVLLLSAAAGHAAESEAKESSDTLEAARRDLQELRTLERTLTPTRRLPESTPQLQLILPSSPSTKATESDAAKPIEPSQGWLLDALKKTETFDRTGSKGQATDERSSPEAARRKLQGAPNPLSNYLQQWLSPQDRRLLGGGTLNPSALERAGIRADEPFRPLPASESKALSSTSPERRSLLEERVNPYLTPVSPEENFLSESQGSQAKMRTPAESPARLSKSGTELPTYSPQLDTTPTLSGPSKPEPLPPPTAPLLDERRYFPQLRRF